MAYNLEKIYKIIMKITLDLDLLLSEGKITQAVYEKFNDLAARSTSSPAFNIMVGFGVIAVSGGALALVPSAITALIIGLIIFIAGLLLLRGALTQWKVLANTVATFAGIHFYTQWFEMLGASPTSILLAGLLVLGFALGLKKLNVRMVKNN